MVALYPVQCFFSPSSQFATRVVIIMIKTASEMHVQYDRLERLGSPNDHTLADRPRLPKTCLQMMPQRHAPDEAPDMSKIVPQMMPQTCPRHGPDDAPDMPQMMPQTFPRKCPTQAPDDAQTCPRHGPDDAPDIPKMMSPVVNLRPISFIFDISVNTSSKRTANNDNNNNCDQIITRWSFC